MYCYYENDFLLHRIKGKIHNKIIFCSNNFRKHIKVRHPEMTFKKIRNVLEEPDYVFKPSSNSIDYYYEKKLGKDIYRVVVSKYKKHVKKVVTAYKVCNKEKFTVKHVYCVYDKVTYEDYNAKQKELEDDIDYFYELFGIAK